MLSPARLAWTESAYGVAQPPCSKPPRRSSSGRPGACMTPSSVRFVNTTTLLISNYLRLSLLLLWTRCYLQMASGYILLFQQHEGQSAMLQARTSRPTDSSPRCFSILQTTLQIMRLPVAAVMRLATTARRLDVDRARQR